ncbi:MAG: tetratricopeptide repeat protein [Myxococcales bacterium]
MSRQREALLWFRPWLRMGMWLAAAVLAVLLTAAGSPVSGATTPATSSGGSSPQMSAPLTAIIRSTELGKSAERSFDEWRFQEGRAHLAALVAKTPGSSEASYLEGYARFLEGDYAGALTNLNAAAKAAPGDPTIKELAALAGAAGEAVKDHKEARSTHFVIRYPVEDAVLVPYALEALESAYNALSSDLGFSAEMPIRIEFYRSPSDLAVVSSLSVAEVARTGTIALCKWARLMVTTPRALSYGYPWLDSINHELVHYAVSMLSRDRAPVWLQEGLAKFLESRWREPAGARLAPSMEHLLAKALRGGKLISFDAMHPSMAKLPSAEDASLAFAEVATAVGYLHAHGGMPALRATIAAVSNGVDARKAVATAAQGDWADFERGWKAYMAGLKLKLYPGFDIPTAHIRKAGAIASRRRPNEDEALNGTSFKGTGPLRFLRLGNMMLKRNRLRAAVLEYEKGARAAAQASGRAGAAAQGPDAAAAQWLFPVKLGRTYLALGEPERALKALAGVQTVYPELPWPNLIAGQALLAKGDAPGAIAAVRASLATNPFDPAVHCTLADAYARLPAAARPAAERITREQEYCRELAE